MSQSESQLFPFSYLDQPLVEQDDDPSAPQAMGFRGVGKLTGTHMGVLFQKLLSSFVEKNVYDAFDIDLSFERDLDVAYCHVPPELQPRILAELAVGLLVPSTPLPHDTVVNHVMFYWLFTEFLTDTHVIAEIEDFSMKDGHSFHEENMEKIQEGVANTMAMGALAQAEQHWDRKATKKGAKKEGLKKADDATLMAVATEAVPDEIFTDADDRALAATVKTVLEASAINENESAGVFDPEVHDYDYFDWRRSLRKALSESWVARKMPALIPKAGCGDMKRWRLAMRWWLSGPEPLILLPKKSSFLCTNDNTYRRLGSCAPATLARREMIRLEVLAVLRAFEAAWTPGNANFSLRVLQYLSGCGIPEDNRIGQLWYLLDHKNTRGYAEKMLAVLGNKEHKMHEKAVAEFTEKADNAEHANRIVEREMHRYRSMLWVEGVREYVVRNSLDLNDPENMYAALRHAISEDPRTNCVSCLEHGGLQIMTHPKEVRLARAEERKYDHCGYSECFAKTLRSDLLRCGGCKVVMYCSKECQKKDWADHKKVCKLIQTRRIEGEEQRAGGESSGKMDRKGEKKKKKKKKKKKGKR
jgi:hypothetical protein